MSGFLNCPIDEAEILGIDSRFDTFEQFHDRVLDRPSLPQGFLGKRSTDFKGGCPAFERQWHMQVATVFASASSSQCYRLVEIMLWQPLQGAVLKQAVTHLCAGGFMPSTDQTHWLCAHLVECPEGPSPVLPHPLLHRRVPNS